MNQPLLAALCLGLLVLGVAGATAGSADTRPPMPEGYHYCPPRFVSGVLAGDVSARRVRCRSARTLVRRWMNTREMPGFRCRGVRELAYETYLERCAAKGGRRIQFGYSL